MYRILSCLFAVLLASPLMAQAEPELKSSDLKKLSGPLGKWADATFVGDYDKISDALVDLDKAIVKLEKKLKGRSAMALVGDWSLAMSSGRKFATSGKNPEGDAIKRGEATLVDLAGFGTAAVWLPAEYEPKKNSYPVLQLMTATPEASLASLPPEVKKASVILAIDITGLKAENLMEEQGRYLFMLPLARATRDFRIDRSRVYLLGEGDEGIDYASRYAAVLPHFFAGLATVAGSSEDFPGKANLALLPNQEHVDLAAAAEWSLEQAARDPYPMDFEVVLTQPWMGRAYWVQALRFDPAEAIPEGKQARMKIKVDRGTNTVNIEAEYVYEVKLFLNDVLLDLDKPIRLVRNGQEMTYQASRSIGTYLEAFKVSTDDSVYPAAIRSLDIPVLEGEGQ